MFVILLEKCFSLCDNQIDQMIACQIMTKTLIDLDLTPKDMKNSKRVIRSLEKLLELLKITYKTLEDIEHVTNKWESNSIQSHKGCKR